MSANHVWKSETTHLQNTLPLPDHTTTLSNASRFLCATNCCYRPLSLSQVVHPDSIYSLHYTLLKMCSNFTHSFWVRVWHQISVCFSAKNWCAIFRPVRKFAERDY